MVKLFFILSFFIQVARNNKKNICIVDIDNTLADTWKSFLEIYSSESDRLANLSPLNGMIKKIKSNRDNDNIIFISARSYRHYFLTRRWLKKQNLPVTMTNVLLVNGPLEKYYFLEKIHNSHEVTYYDDLSFGHEKGSVLFYEKTIKMVNELNLTYVDYDKIKRINNYEN